MFQLISLIPILFFPFQIWTLQCPLGAWIRFWRHLLVRHRTNPEADRSSSRSLSPRWWNLMGWEKQFIINHVLINFSHIFKCFVDSWSLALTLSGSENWLLLGKTSEKYGNICTVKPYINQSDTIPVHKLTICIFSCNLFFLLSVMFCLSVWQTVEERRTVRDSQGNEETTVTRSGGPSSLEGPDRQTGPVIPGQSIHGGCF